MNCSNFSSHIPATVGRMVETVEINDRGMLSMLPSRQSRNMEHPIVVVTLALIHSFSFLLDFYLVFFSVLCQENCFTDKITEIIACWNTVVVLVTLEVIVVFVMCICKSSDQSSVLYS